MAFSLSWRLTQLTKAGNAPEPPPVVLGEWAEIERVKMISDDAWRDTSFSTSSITDDDDEQQREESGTHGDLSKLTSDSWC